MFLLGNWKIYVLELWIILFLLRDILILVLHGIYKKLEFIATFRLMKVSFFFFRKIVLAFLFIFECVLDSMSSSYLLLLFILFYRI